MVFSSNLFLFAFLPLFLACYYAMPMKSRSAVILIFSYGFYAWWRPDFLGILLGVSLVSYGLALAIDAEALPSKRYRLLFVGVSLNLLALAYFKYANFGVDSLNLLLQSLGIEPLNFSRVLFPICLSVYIFHAIS